MKFQLTFWTIALSGLLNARAFAKETIMLPMRDRVKLATDVHRPVGTNSLPVILGRTPYNKNGLDGIGAEAIKRGFILVAQDCRGRFASEGENLPFNLDGPDGFDTLEWIAKQPWCNGRIGTWGGSAGAITQFQMIASGTDKISAQHLTVGAPNLYEVVYVNGVFRKALVEDWLRGAQWGSNALPRWVAHPIYDDYWRERDASLDYRKANAPTLHIGGYWDIFAQGTIDAFVGYQEKGGPNARGKQRLVMGPIEVTGRVRARLWISADVPDTDFIARLCDVYPDGRSFNLCEGAVRTRFRESGGRETFLQAGKVYPIDVDLWSTSVIFNSGHRIRLQITSSSAPGYDPNPNTGAPFRANSETRKANIRLYLDSQQPPHVVLPIVIEPRP